MTPWNLVSTSITTSTPLRRGGLALLLAGALAACGDDDGSTGDGTGDIVDAGDGVDAGSDVLAAPPDGEGLQLVHQYTLEPGGEVHYCQYYVLPDDQVDVGRFEHRFSLGGHHIILYPTTLAAADVEGNLDVFDCDTLPNRGDVGFAYAQQAREGEEAYPAGIGRRFEPGAVVLLESHMLNPTDATIDVDYRLNLWLADGPIDQEVGTIFFYDNHIYLPPRSSGEARMSCAVPADIQVLSLLPHMHTRGVEFNSFLAGGDLETPTPLVSSTTWQTEEPTLYDPPLAVSAGQRFEFDCAYQNPDDHPVIEGASKIDNEMCLLIGTYYPRIDFPFEFCLDAESGSLLDGDKTCGESFNCLGSATDPIAAEQCETQTCAAASAEFNDAFNCVARECFFPGNCDDTGCTGCIFERCAAQVGACQAATCEE